MSKNEAAIKIEKKTSELIQKLIQKNLMATFFSVCSTKLMVVMKQGSRQNTSASTYHVWKYKKIGLNPFPSENKYLFCKSDVFPYFSQSEKDKDCRTCYVLCNKRPCVRINHFKT